MGNSPMLFPKELAEAFVREANRAFKESMGVEFEACLLHVDGGPDVRCLTVIGGNMNNLYLRHPSKRVPQDEDDWGDEFTIGIHLQTRDGHKRFGSKTARFIGISGKCLVIGIKTASQLDFECTVFYPTMEQATKDWIVD